MQGGYRADAWGPLLPAASGWASEFSSTGCLVFASQVLLKPRVFTLRIMVKILLVSALLFMQTLIESPRLCLGFGNFSENPRAPLFGAKTKLAIKEDTFISQQISVLVPLARLLHFPFLPSHLGGTSFGHLSDALKS